MYVLYLDESGDENNPSDKHFVLAGAALFERQTFFLAQQMDAIQTQYFPGVPPIEFHASHIRSSRGFWRKVDRAVKASLLRDIGAAIANCNHPGLALFGAVVEKDPSVPAEVTVKRAAERVCRGFDVFLMRRHHEFEDPQRGLIVFAEGRFHQRARVWVQGFRELGTQWGILRNLSDIPYFASTKETRLLQVADYVSHAIFRLYEAQDVSLINPILRRFDQKDGVLHGLVHLTRSRACQCPACASRRSPGHLGPWTS